MNYLLNDFKQIQVSTLEKPDKVILKKRNIQSKRNRVNNYNGSKLSKKNKNKYKKEKYQSE